MPLPNHKESSSSEEVFRPLGLLDILIAELNKGQFRTEGPRRATKPERRQPDADDDGLYADDGL